MSKKGYIGFYSNFTIIEDPRRMDKWGRLTRWYWNSRWTWNSFKEKVRSWVH
jgi:hypothetical protein